jgi:hypothetical protein
VTIEISADTVETYTLPRLKRVVAGEDEGGITRREVAVPEYDLPKNVAPADVWNAQRTIAALQPLLEVMEDDLAGAVDIPRLLSALRILSTTTIETDQQWTGGGGFRLIEVRESAYVYVNGRIALADWAVGDSFTDIVAAQLGFSRVEDPVFAARKHRKNLAVVDGVADADTVETVVSKLQDGETVTMVAKSVAREAQALMRRLSPGSTVLKAPRDLFARKVIR